MRSFAIWIYGKAWACNHRRSASSGRAEVSRRRLEADNARLGGATMATMLRSGAFQDGGSIPLKYTCDGDDVSPPLEWGGMPPQTRSFALIVDDPDAPGGVFTHWVVF